MLEPRFPTWAALADAALLAVTAQPVFRGFVRDFAVGTKTDSTISPFQVVVAAKWVVGSAGWVRAVLFATFTGVGGHGLTPNG